MISYMKKKKSDTCTHVGNKVRIVPQFSSGIVEWVKCERAWKSPHMRKGDMQRGERKMRDYRQSPSFWPFMADLECEAGPSLSGFASPILLFTDKNRLYQSIATVRSLLWPYNFVWTDPGWYFIHQLEVRICFLTPFAWPPTSCTWALIPLNAF